MNHLRRAAEAGAKLRIFRAFKDNERREFVNPTRRIKKDLSLSGRQLKKLRKQLAREERAQARAAAAAAPPPASDVVAPRRPLSPRPGPGASAELHTPGAI